VGLKCRLVCFVLSSFGHNNRYLALKVENVCFSVSSVFLSPRYCHFHFMSEDFASLFPTLEIRAGPAIYRCKLAVFRDEVSDQFPVLLPRMAFASPETC
jgi:hypothetical protein